MLHKIKSLTTLLVAGLLPGLAIAALAGVNYSNDSGNNNLVQTTGQLAPSAVAIANATEGRSGGGASVSTSGTGVPSQKGNVNAVSALLHPKAKEVVVIGPPEPMEFVEVEERVMDNSINAYRGRCACPYSRNADGFECGVEAAYYKPGGFRIYCYPEDVRGQLNIFYRKTH